VWLEDPLPLPLPDVPEEPLPEVLELEPLLAEG
jgi:hypothetical protein